jgi:glutathionyl-hydroquinone reductase
MLINLFRDFGVETFARRGRRRNHIFFIRLVSIYVCSQLEERLNNSKSGYIVGNKLTVADIQVYQLTSMDERFNFDGLPALKTHKGLISSQAGIAKWLKERPVTPF